MGKYLFTYTGGVMAQSDAEREAVMAKWMGWFQGLGPAVADMGAPFGGSAAVGSGADTALTGYSVITADSLEAATALAQDCPVLEGGGGVGVHEALEM
jgi:hypothetical protein